MKYPYSSKGMIKYALQDSSTNQEFQYYLVALHY